MRLGGFRLWRWLNRDSIAILALHGVIGEEVVGRWSPLRRPYSANKLERGLRALQRWYRFIPMRDAVEMIEGRRPVEAYSMVLTFDDGYLNQFRYALPVLRKLGIPASFYIATGLIDRREPYWFDRLDYVLQKANVSSKSVRVGDRSVTFDGGDRASVGRSFRRLREYAKNLPKDDDMLAILDTFAESLEAESGERLRDVFEGDDWSGLPHWDELRDVSRDPLVELGSHTASHARLAHVSAPKAREELAVSRQRLEQEIGRPCVEFCYPSGSYDAAVASLVREAGYRCAVTSDAGLNRPGADLFKLKRVHFPEFEDDAGLFTAVSGFNVFLSRLRARLRGS